MNRKDFRPLKDEYKNDKRKGKYIVAVKVDESKQGKGVYVFKTKEDRKNLLHI
jgi:hypothetical protein